MLKLLLKIIIKITYMNSIIVDLSDYGYYPNISNDKKKEALCSAVSCLTKDVVVKCMLRLGENNEIILDDVLNFVGLDTTEYIERYGMLKRKHGFESHRRIYNQEKDKLLKEHSALKMAVCAGDYDRKKIFKLQDEINILKCKLKGLKDCEKLN